MRRTSVSLPTKQVRRDPHEKSDRYESGHKEPGILEKLQQAGMNAAQKSRWLKTTAIVVFILFLFYYLSPKGVDYYQGGACLCSP
jgi:guanosine-diphosphatase